MPAGDHDDTPRVRSWITPKAVKGGASAIAGQGAHAVEPIAAGEVVAVKGGHVMDGAAVAGLPDAIRDSAFPIAADCFLAALTREEFDGVMMRVNHSCEPNVGMGATSCWWPCGTAACGVWCRGTDHRRADLGERYRGWFSWWLQQEIGFQRPG